ncbi:hypothetical protein [Winogradskyella alexanderae]|uniref:Uncharacterized protein n=1 Tax=Winogradskyella alexanderae TaxID=2877123 RepID=A0ABS7XR38_9FLAO|nr:hypothetical protein [Winogradskyella alexanderae]MCA0131969.1 hypothetical protein [Winogradskyella alexanderae]
MALKSHVVIIVPDGVGIKNYLYSNLLSYLDKTSIITIWSPLDEGTFEEVKKCHPNIALQYRNLKLFKEPIKTRLYREAATYARLHFFTKKTKNKTLLLNWRKPKTNFKLRVLYAISEFIGNKAKSDYQRIKSLEKRSKLNWTTSIIDYYKSELSELKADHLFITHQRVAGLMPICIASNSMGVKSTTAIFSWDNLPKARLCVETDFYALWSDWMKKDMNLFYPEILDSQLKIVGTPQFEFYKNQKQIKTREEFAQSHGLDSNKLWICFSGDDELTSPYDPKYLQDIAETISRHFDNIQLIFRRCPVDFSDRYDKVLQDYRAVIVPIDPVWDVASKSWVGYFSKIEDISLQVNLAYHCLGVINLGSTMALDFASLDKPCFYINYDSVIDPSWSTNLIYKYHHFGTLDNLNPVGWINSKEEIKKALERLLNGIDDMSVDTKKWMERIVLFPIESNSEKLSKILT